MLLDHDLALCTKGGQSFAPGDGSSAYGTKVIDLGAASPGDPAVGEPLECVGKVNGAAIANITSYTIALVCDSTSATATAEQTLLTKTITVASGALAANSLIKLGRVPTGVSSKRYLKLKVTQTGAGAPGGTLEFWLTKGSDSVVANNVHG